MLNQEIVTFSGDTATAKLDIQIGRGPFAPAADGLVKIGETMTLVVSVEGDPGFDLQVRTDVAHAPIIFHSWQRFTTRVKSHVRRDGTNNANSRQHKPRLELATTLDRETEYEMKDEREFSVKLVWNCVEGARLRSA